MDRLHKVKWGLIPFAVYLAVALACIEQTGGGDGNDCYGSDCTPTDPAKIAQVAEVNKALLGTWLVESDFTGRDDVDRPLGVGKATWEIEIFDVQTNGNTMDNTGYSWRGVIKAVDMCLVDLDNFNPDGGDCHEFAPVELGSCNAHTCTRYDEREVSGVYDAESEEFNLERAPADIYFLDPLTGYINFDHTINFTIFLGQSREPTECESWCNWTLSPAGLYVDEYPSLASDDTPVVRTFTPMGGDVRPAESEVVSEPEEIEIGSEIATSEILIHDDWNVRLQFESRDDVDRPITVGHANYTLDIFEVTAGGKVGLWNWKGALQGESLCFVSNEQAEAGTYQCDVFGPGIIGSCSGPSCTAREESPLEGTFNDLDGAFHIDYGSADIYYLDGQQGWISYDTYIFVQTAPLISQRVESTPFESWSSWSVSTSGAFEATHDDGWESSAKYFEMSR